PALHSARVLEEKGAPVLLGKTAAVLPAHERMDLGLGEHRAADSDQQSGAIERLQMLAQVRVAPPASGRRTRCDGHLAPSLWSNETVHVPRREALLLTFGQALAQALRRVLAVSPDQ